MRKRKYLDGDIVQNLRVLNVDIHKTSITKTYYWCECRSCGGRASFQENSLRQRIQKGWVKCRKCPRPKLVTNAYKNTREFTTWKFIASNHQIDKKWLDFVEFLKDVGEYQEGSRASKIDARKPYGPGNFYWRFPRTW